MRMPPEWDPHRATWMAWPHDPELWGAVYSRVVEEFVELSRLIASRERLELLVHESIDIESLTGRFSGTDAEFHQADYGDIWLRDTAPLFVHREGALSAVSLRFNGWGEKYRLDGDMEVAEFVARSAGATLTRLDWIGEGGALDFDGAGYCLASAACLFSEQRNARMTRDEIESSLQQCFGVDRVIWLSRILQGDHTDGHVDTLARFIGPGTVACATPQGNDDPNADALLETYRELQAAEGLRILELPSPGAVRGSDGTLLPASYLNFYIGNSFVAVPTYGCEQDDEAVSRVAQWFPGRDVVGLSARGIVEGGGAFHCITQQEPKYRS